MRAISLAGTPAARNLARASFEIVTVAAGPALLATVAAAMLVVPLLDIDLSSDGFLAKVVDVVLERVFRSLEMFANVEVMFIDDLLLVLSGMKHPSMGATSVNDASPVSRRLDSQRD